ncbi:fimbrial protein pilin [Candidatus Saccharibacteria bacterium RAAC3_TM7_1]|nr:fimbrial protein pilin [Candidatus Saccharibacteria bacterium RAAC3_TM7_1]
MNKTKLSYGFTIIELILVIVVIAILAAITTVSYNGIQERSRDTRRLNDAKVIEDALEIYLQQNGSFFEPVYESGQSEGGWESSALEASGDFMKPLMTSGLMDKMPVDPVNNSTMHYRYYVYAAGSAGCDASKGKFAVFQITDFETSGRPYEHEPGFQCPSRNWSTEADYTVGIFEKD